MTERLEPDSARSEPWAGPPDSQVYGSLWPASRLTYGQIRTLRQISKDVRLPITQLLKDAVDIYLMIIQREMQAIMVAEKTGQPKIIESNASADGVTIPDQQLVAEDGLPLTSVADGPTR